MGYYYQLKQFLDQAKTGDLKTKHFDSEYRGTKVVVSFGQGAIANVPWISFLKGRNTTQEGIYPAYLYFKDLEILILAYGVSETRKPHSLWRLVNAKSIKDFFVENYNKDPYRYGSSFIYKVYDAENLPFIEVIESDLDELIKLYDSQYEQMKNEISITSNLFSNEFIISKFQNALASAGLTFSDEIITRFVASLITKPFVILTGLSGSGKTKLAQAFVQWICKNNNQYKIVPVGADWTNREPLLGYPNALKAEDYVKPDSGALDLILNALSNPDLSYFLILDEMNLSHVERYFADFLSVMESKEEILLHSSSLAITNVPERIKIPSNLFIIGTVNIDETTNMFSPKVLDRANTIEFRISSTDMSEFLNSKVKLNMELLKSKGSEISKNFLELSENKSFANEESEIINKTLLQFFNELKPLGSEFGYRGATEMIRLINQLSIIDSNLKIHQRLDIAIVQKLLPKLHGSRKKLAGPLEVLAGLCLKRKKGSAPNEQDKTKTIYHQFIVENRIDSNWEVLYPISFEKIERMLKNAIDNGFTSFAEA